MDPRVNYTLVGLFVVVLGSALVTTVIWLSTETSDKVYKTYVAYVYESVAGLNPRAPVKYRGVDVGQVREISIDKENPERVRLLLDIEESTPVKQDTMAVLSMQGITGLAFVDLTGGSKDSPPLQAAAGQPYPQIRVGPSLLVRLDTAVSTSQTELVEVAYELKSVARRIKDLLNDGNQQALSNTLKHIETITQSVALRADIVKKDLEHVSTILDNTARVSNELPRLINGATSGLTAIEETVDTVNHTARNLNRLVTDAHQDLAWFSRNALGQVNPLLVELRQLIETLRRLSQDLERNPSMLLFDRPPPLPGPGE